MRARCRAGSVEWTSAYGALRLELQPFLRGDFRLCFVLDSRHTLAQVSQETPASRHTSTPRLRNYRLRQEGDETLSFRRPGMTPLVTAEDGASREVCVTSRAGQPVLLYVEVQRTTRFTGLPSVVLQYDVEASSDAGLSDPMEGEWMVWCVVLARAVLGNLETAFIKGNSRQIIMLDRISACLCYRCASVDQRQCFQSEWWRETCYRFMLDSGRLTCN